jgi:hypothetical protein
MRTYVIAGDRVAVHSATPDSIPDGGVIVRRIDDLDEDRFPVPGLVALWNALPGATPVKRFQSRDSGVKRLWEALARLPLGGGVRPNSKHARIIGLLQRPQGADMAELMSATGWQAHSVRGTLSGVLRKKLGLEIDSVRSGNTSVYRIVS